MHSVLCLSSLCSHEIHPTVGRFQYHSSIKNNNLFWFPVFIGTTSLVHDSPITLGAPTNGPSIHELLDKVKATSKWRMIGIGLCVSSEDLDTIQFSTGPLPNSTQQALEKVFTIWREKATSSFSWSNLISVLKKGFVGEIRLAQELEKIYLC